MGFPNLKHCRHAHPSHFLSEGALKVLKDFEQIDHITADMKNQNMHQYEKEAFAMAALAYRCDPTDDPAPVTPSQLLLPRRREDPNSDLWTTSNRVQEGAVKAI